MCLSCTVLCCAVCRLQLLRSNWEDQHELKDGLFGPLHTVALYNDLLSEGLAAK